MKLITDIDEQSFAVEVLESRQPVIVDFYAVWCGPCKMLAPLLENLAETFRGRLKFAKLNVDEAPDIAARYEISGVPTLVCFVNGKRTGELVGLVPPAALKTWLERWATPVAEVPLRSQVGS